MRRAISARPNSIAPSNRTPPLGQQTSVCSHRRYVCMICVCVRVPLAAAADPKQTPSERRSGKRRQIESIMERSAALNWCRHSEVQTGATTVWRELKRRQRRDIQLKKTSAVCFLTRRENVHSRCVAITEDSP